MSLVEDFEDLKEYGRWCRVGAYQVLEAAEGVEVRVMVGRFGYVREFKDKKDPLLEDILAYCKVNDYIKIAGQVSDDYFFSARNQ